MDPITHGALGGAAAQVLFYRRISPALTWAGILGAMAPDLDVLIHSKSDPLLFLIYHRSFSHSLLFIPVGGATVGILLWLLLGRRHRLRDLIVAAIAGYATHGLLDACTTYGTLLFWPFSHWRISWDFISIIDPIYTAILIGGVIWASVTRRGRAALIALGISTLYMGFGVWQHHRALQFQQSIAAARGDEIVDGRVMPSLANLFVWRSVYRSDGNLHVDALRIGPALKLYWEGGSLPRIGVTDIQPPPPPGSLLQRDLETFEWFAEGYTALLKKEPWEVADLRFSSLPNGTQPLWGIRFDTSDPDRHVERLRYPWSRGPGLTTLGGMLRGSWPGSRPPPKPFEKTE